MSAREGIRTTNCPVSGGVKPSADKEPLHGIKQPPGRETNVCFGTPAQAGHFAGKDGASTRDLLVRLFPSVSVLT